MFAFLLIHPTKRPLRDITFSVRMYYVDLAGGNKMLGERRNGSLKLNFTINIFKDISIILTEKCLSAPFYQTYQQLILNFSTSIQTRNCFIDSAKTLRSAYQH